MFDKLMARCTRITLEFGDGSTEVIDPPIVPPVDPPAFKFYTVDGVAGQDFYLRDDRRKFAADEPIWFHFRVQNVTSAAINYGVIAARCEEGPHAFSWTKQVLTPGQVLEWDDHMPTTPPAGVYHIYLALSFATWEEADANPALWKRLSDSLTITVE